MTAWHSQAVATLRRLLTRAKAACCLGSLPAWAEAVTGPAQQGVWSSEHMLAFCLRE